ncbi:MAG: DUF4340 domain-containing protein [Lentisphaerae bacterium]|nr:DUF4340 domain-containing protein [Lentisphaerota bacterium]
MSARTTVTLFLTAVLLACLIWLSDRKIEPTEIRAARRRAIPLMDLANVERIVIDRGDFHVDCTLNDGNWQLENPVKALANNGEIDRILSVIEALSADDIITAEERRKRQLGMRDYGLLQPRARICLRGTSGSQELWIGSDSPVGNCIYIRVDSNENIFSTSRDILEVIPDNIDQLRDRIVIHGSPSRTARLEIQTPAHGFIQLTQSDGEWLIQQPVSARADIGKIFEMLNALYSLPVEKFVWDSDVSGDRDVAVTVEPQDDSGTSAEPRHLDPDEADVRIRVWVDDDRIGKELLIGQITATDPNLVYAKLRDNNSIFSVHKKIRDIFSVTVADLRDKYVFPLRPDAVKNVIFKKGDRRLVLVWDVTKGWFVWEPVQWRADELTVRSMLTRMTQLTTTSFMKIAAGDLAEYGLAPPDFEVTLATADRSAPALEKVGAIYQAVEEKDKSFTLMIGSRQNSDGDIYAKLADTDCVLTISLKEAASFGPDVVDPLIYHDRTMLAILPENVRSITLKRGTDIQSIKRTDSGGWIAADQGKENINFKAIDDILFFAANLRANRIECRNPQDLSLYGLKEPGSVLTFGLIGKEGIQKSVLIGSSSKLGGIYAMVLGQDVIFVLDNSVVNRLTQNLILEGK